MTQTISMRIVRKLDPSILTQPALEYLAMREGFEPTFPWVDNDAVREAEFTDEVVEATVGFGVANADGELMRETSGLQSAERAVRGARLVFEVDGLEDE